MLLPLYQLRPQLRPSCLASVLSTAR